MFWIDLNLQNPDTDILVNHGRMSKYEKGLVYKLADIIKKSRLSTEKLSSLTIRIVLIANVSRSGSHHFKRFKMNIGQPLFQGISDYFLELSREKVYDCNRIVDCLDVLGILLSEKNKENLSEDFVNSLWNLLSDKQSGSNVIAAVLKVLCNIFRNRTNSYHPSQKHLNFLIFHVEKMKDSTDAASHEIFQLCLGVLINLIQNFADWTKILCRSPRKGKSALSIILSIYLERLVSLDPDVYHVIKF